MELILVGVDRSEASSRAVRFACARAQQEEAGVFLVHVIPWSPYSFTTQDELQHRTTVKQKEIEAATEQIMAPMVELAESLGAPVHTAEVRHGDPVDMMIALADSFSVAEIVVGRTGDSRIRRAIFGSLPSHLTQMASVPVTVVP
ncbi:universal stress protein [Serinibacter salmoneus]|uniref:Nucleotide-binding universal stress UspA family protein n=1 Tax=Serinibacter salmoneus TaxID=556530 RepID=A0A2A9D3Q1_9MICO|nr:universal stress protein [Serinibacter salmoneus]PFG21283.1 nucleotide-binding universal stress UspA family protein [Serinibacter salmoneus]